MTPQDIGRALGDSRHGEETLANLDEGAGPEVARAIRASFEGGDEQGNERRLEALVKIEGEGALDVIRAVLEDTVEVGGIYSNLRNVALPLIAAHFPGDPRLRESVFRAIEIDEYLDPDVLAEVLIPYDPARALEVLLPSAEAGVPAALRALWGWPEARTKLVEILDAALADPSRGSRMVEALGELARESELATRILPHVDTIPAAAEMAMARDPSLARTVAERIASDDSRWRTAGVRALALLAADDVFERASPFFSAGDRAKPAGRARVESIVWGLREFTDPRWFDHLVARLGEETNKPLRGLLVAALGKLGPAAAPIILAAARDDQDTSVLDELPDALAQIGPERGTLELVRAAAASATGKRKKALKAALELLEA